MYKYFLLTLFIICASFSSALCCMYLVSSYTSYGTTYRNSRFGRRSGYTKIINDTEKGRPPSYN